MYLELLIAFGCHTHMHTHMKKGRDEGVQEAYNFVKRRHKPARHRSFKDRHITKQQTSHRTNKEEVGEWKCCVGQKVSKQNAFRYVLFISILVSTEILIERNYTYKNSNF